MNRPFLKRTHSTYQFIPSISKEILIPILSNAPRNLSTIHNPQKGIQLWTSLRTTRARWKTRMSSFFREIIETNQEMAWKNVQEWPGKKKCKNLIQMRALTIKNGKSDFFPKIIKTPKKWSKNWKMLRNQCKGVNFYGINFAQCT